MSEPTLSVAACLTFKRVKTKGSKNKSSAAKQIIPLLCETPERGAAGSGRVFVVGQAGFRPWCIADLRL